MTIYLGIDAGNSKTAVLACLASGMVAGAARAGCGDIYGAAGEAAAVRTVLGAVDAALAEAGADQADVASAAFRLAGVDWPEDREFWDAVLSLEWPGLARSILNDGYAPIRCGEPSGVGVAVNAGTAGAIAARGPDGATWDMGWWGQHALGATGLVSEAFRAAFLAEIGGGPATALGPALVDFYGLPDVTELNHWFTRRQNAAAPAQRTRAARVVVDAARHGDAVATAIVDEQGRRLAFYAEIAARHAGLRDRGEPIPVVLSGSVLMDPDSPVAAAMCEHLPGMLPGADPRRTALPPAAGAALDALAEGGVTVTDEVVARLAVSMPPSSFFQASQERHADAQWSAGAVLSHPRSGSSAARRRREILVPAGRCRRSSRPSHTSLHVTFVWGQALIRRYLVRPFLDHEAFLTVWRELLTP